MNDLLKKQNWDRFLRFISTANVKGAFFSRFKKKNRHILKVFSIFFLIVLLLMEADISFAQTDSFLSKDSARILFIGNGNVGSEGGLHHHFRRTVAKADSSLSIQTDWLGMYDKPTLADMYTDDLVQRIKTGDDDLLVVSSGSSEAMHKFARLAQETEKKIVFFCNLGQ